MDDVDGPDVAAAVYEELLSSDANELDLERVPYALDVAVAKMRQRGLSASRWAPYLHIGA